MRVSMRRWIQKLVVVLANGYILFFYSERVFWSFLRPGDKLTDLVLGWLMYSLLTWVCLLLVRHCRIAAFPAVFLAGAVYGWLAEGIVVDTMFGNKDNPFPASISFTGLAWHALISVGVGWYWQEFKRCPAGSGERRTGVRMLRRLCSNVRARRAMSNMLSP